MKPIDVGPEGGRGVVLQGRTEIHIAALALINYNDGSHPEVKGPLVYLCAVLNDAGTTEGTQVPFGQDIGVTVVRAVAGYGRGPSIAPVSSAQGEAYMMYQRYQGTAGLN